ncbi:hypothetical protein B9Z55_014224 [Caenorhabditis nigoni]|uniref:Uncharacterized protein n=1 Tax=Caenorhabditis nigoni TaxID=1611254 RepID=A0A2G5U506_9PELO|nr:hypothetical protein B9Z55_014224 [Caenorhabditis nigoni]
MKHKLCLLLIFALVLSSIADSSDDDDKDKDKHSEDDPEDGHEEKTQEEKGEEYVDGPDQDGEISATLITENPTSEDEKEGKNKNETKKEEEWSAADVDAMFLGTATKKPTSEDNSAHHTQAPPPSGSGSGSGFGGGTGNWGSGGGFWEQVLGSSGSGLSAHLDATSAPVEPVTTPQPSEPAKEESKDESGDTQGSHGTVGGNSFYPLPRQVDIWDRLFVLAAFPICFFAVLLKAEMFR